MKIYDYYDDSSYLSQIFLIITVVCAIIIFYLIINTIKTVKGNGVGIQTAVHLLPIVIVTVLLFFVSRYTYNLVKFDSICKNQKYETVTGNMKLISVERNDYRDTEEYDIAFSVDGVILDNIVNKFSKEQKEKLLSVESKTITVHYSYIANELAIYQIYQS
ncbi:MAG: hypothetical protein E7539_00105 [Ruminococcaceae bacterium]|nr:hypothetical protein [Oscillospiraceae bacterium]